MVIVSFFDMLRARTLLQQRTRRIEAFVLEVMAGRRCGPVASFVRMNLRWCSKVFAAAVKLRRLLGISGKIEN